MAWKFSAQFWVAYKIWFIALLTNTIAGTIYLTCNAHFSSAWENVTDIAASGFLIGLFFSFPVPFLLSIGMYEGFRRGLKPRQVFCLLLVSGILLASACYMVFSYLIGGGLIPGLPGLSGVVLLSALAGIFSQYRIFYRHTDSETESIYQPLNKTGQPSTQNELS